MNTRARNSERLGESYPKKPLSWLGLSVILVLCVAALISLSRALGVELIDDSYIFLRYARNLAEGHGPVFNVGGERVEGFSSPLWMLLLGAAGVVSAASGVASASGFAAAGGSTADFEWIASTLGLCCGAGVIVVLLLGVRSVSQGRLGGSLALPDTLVLGLGVATCPALVFWSASGMDAALFTLLVSACLISVLRDRENHGEGARNLAGSLPGPSLRSGPASPEAPGLSVRTAVLLATATLTRPEGVLLAVCAGAFFLYERRCVRVLVGYGVAVALMLLARYSYFGAWVPNTYHAKVTFDWARRFSDGFHYLATAVQTNLPLILALMVVLLIAWRQRKKWRRDEGTKGRSGRAVHSVPPSLRAYVPFVLFLGGWTFLWLAYVIYVGGDNFSMFRFLLPIMPALFLLLAEGWALVSPALRPAARYTALASLVLAFASSHILTYRSQAEFYYGDARLAQSWKKVGRWLNENTPADTVVATVVPGAFGYFGRRTTIDMLGLTDRTVARDGGVYPKAVHGHARYHTDYIFERQPDIVLYHTSGRFDYPRYADPQAISLAHGYALYEFVTDPRCRERYRYETVTLDDGTVIEMQRKRAAGVAPTVVLR